jgi:hypothetical protein
MGAQEFQDNWNRKIKFASIDKQGELVPDAHEEYNMIFQPTIEGWVEEAQEYVKLVSGGQHRAWIFSNGQMQLAAVEHETGLEILVGIGVGIATEAIVSFSKWAWGRWWDARSPFQKVVPSLVAESIEERFPDGRARVIRRLEVRGPLDRDSVAQHLQAFLALSQARLQ